MSVVKEVEQDTSDPSSYQDIPLLYPQDEMENEGSKHYSDEARSPDISNNGFFMEQTLKVRNNTSVMQMHDFVDDQSPRGSCQIGKNGAHSGENGHLSKGNGEWWYDQERQGQVSVEDEPCQIGPRVRCACQVSILSMSNRLLQSKDLISYHFLMTILQILRSVGLWSAGTSQPVEASIHAAYCSLIDKSEYFVYIEVV
jgi:phospholipase D1/2